MILICIYVYWHKKETLHQNRCTVCYINIIHVQKWCQSWFSVVFHWMAYRKFGPIFTNIAKKLVPWAHHLQGCPLRPCYKRFCNEVSWKPFKVALQTRNHKRLEKKYYRNPSRRNNDNIVVTFAILKYGSYEKMTFCACVGHERYKLFWNIFIVIVGVPPSSFFCSEFFVNFFTKGLFLASTTLALQF